MSRSKGIIGSITTAFIIILVVFLLKESIVRVPAGYIAVQYNMRGGIEGSVLTQGWHLVSPTVKTTLYSIGIEQSYLTSEDKGDSPKDESFVTPTSDGKSLKVNLEFSYRFDQDKITDTFTKFKGQSGKEVKNSFIKPKMIAWSQEVTAKYPVTEVFGDKRQELNEALDEYLKMKFEPYGIIIDTVNFTNISTDKQTSAAIQKKVNAQQELELANIEAKTAKINAEKEKEVALIAAEQKKEQAKIEAEATKIKAKAQAEANKKISDSLTDKLLKKIAYEQWNGKLPTVSGSNMSITNIDSLLNDKSE